MTQDFQNADYGSARSEAFEIMSLGLEAQAIVVDLPAWSPGATLESLLTSAGDDLGAGASQFIDGLDAFDTDTMRSGALRMDSGGGEVSLAQTEFDRLAALYGGSCL